MASKMNSVEAWTGDFGDAYTDRNSADDERISQRMAMWRRILPAMSASPPATVLEVGANIGINLTALKGLTDATLYALEPNDTARALLASKGVVEANRILAGTADQIALPEGAVDLVFTSGVLIHVDPDALPASYREIYRISSRYILTIEYFSAEPEQKLYRGQGGLLFKRDFGALWLELFPELTLVEYGFFWKEATGLDNLTWWLFRKP